MQCFGLWKGWRDKFGNYLVLFRLASDSFVFASAFCCFTSMRNKQKYAFFALPSTKIFSLWFHFSLWKRKRRRTLSCIALCCDCRMLCGSPKCVDKNYTHLLFSSKCSIFFVASTLYIYITSFYKWGNNCALGTRVWLWMQRLSYNKAKTELQKIYYFY